MKYAILSLCLCLASALVATAQEPPIARTIYVSPVVRSVPTPVAYWPSETRGVVVGQPTAQPVYYVINGRLYLASQVIGYPVTVSSPCVGGNCPKR